jgi:hypothetical protein
MPVEIDGNGFVSGLSTPTSADQASPKSFVESSVESSDTLAELNDTTIFSPADGETLVYNSATSVFENKPARIKTYADAATRTSSSPTPAEGDLSYLQDTDAVEVYDGSSWVGVGPSVVGKVIQVATATSNGTYTTTSSSYTDANLSIAFTPLFASSNIIVTWTFNTNTTRNGGDQQSRFDYKRITNAGVQVPGAEGEFGRQEQINSGISQTTATSGCVRGIEAAVSTSARTYQTQWRVGSGLQTSTLTEETLTVMEVGP